MNRVAPSTLVIVAVVCLAVGGVAGFFLGMAATDAGRAFLAGVLQDEEQAEVSRPETLVRAGFELQYPSNWRVDADADDYDPDTNFSIDSPGSTFVMFVIGSGATDPEETLQILMRPYEKLMSSPAVDRFERYGRLSGRGATLKGRIMGVKTTAKLFAFHQDELTVMITQQYPDEDLKRVQGGLDLIERSFLPRTNKHKEASKVRDAGDSET